jgi:hypothetical protein
MKRKLLVFLFPWIVCLFSTSLAAQTPFERMDFNNDGKLSRMEFRGPPQAFMRLDRNNDGYISRQEASGTRLSGGVEQTRPIGSGSPARESAELIYVDTHKLHIERKTWEPLKRLL